MIVRQFKWSHEARLEQMFHRPPIVQRYMRQCPVNSLCASRCSPNFSHFDWSPYEASYSGPEHMCYIRHRNFG
ncbi:hypothetical protein Bpfe_021491 [Biomphalaria pfeifferi]|uniref:Uncharacterized protein n=1 Tax=Biomphalaria pfeifferi TaxID=112525 RepID=A0AAD8B6Q7_BIOPF|nr:hypothetical protein Bpfe_021491 [Biomphalaria pfeifferi]